MTGGAKKNQEHGESVHCALRNVQMQEERKRGRRRRKDSRVEISRR